MSEYHCIRCGYKTELKKHILQHVHNKKKPCPPCLADVDHFAIMEDVRNQIAEIAELKKAQSTVVMDHHQYVCHFCDKGFVTRGGRSVHIRKAHPEVTNPPENGNVIIDSQNVNIHIENLNINVDGATFNELIRNFGEENTSYITADQKKAVIAGGHDVICTLIKLVHFNIQHPENHNVKLQSIKRKLVSVKYPSDWQIKAIRDIVSQMYRKIAEECLKLVSAADRCANVHTANNVARITNPSRTQINDAVTIALAELLNFKDR